MHPEVDLAERLRAPVGHPVEEKNDIFGQWIVELEESHLHIQPEAAFGGICREGVVLVFLIGIIILFFSSASTLRSSGDSEVNQEWYAWS